MSGSTNIPAGAAGPRRVSRRRFLQSAAAGGAALAIDACGIEPPRVEVTRHEIALPPDAAGLAGMRIAQVSDTHLTGNRRAAERAVELIALERPDVVVLTGDICEDIGGLRALTELTAAVRGASATVAIYGNWERKARIPEAALARAYERGGAELLVSRSVLVGRGASRLRLVGLDDARYVGPDLGRALAGDAGDAEVWLVHCPQYADLVPDAIPAPMALLAGHTHGGQVRLPGWTPYTPPGSGRFVEGWYRDAKVPMYVTRGIGTAVVEARFCCRPELPIFTLVATRAAAFPDSRGTDPRPGS
jgi:predicted MPP superfamily phosphohydrolase